MMSSTRFSAATDPRAAGKVFNVGNPVDHALIEIARAVIAAAASDSGLRCREWPSDHQRIDIGSFRTDSSAIASALGWRAATELEEGMRRTASFYRGHPWYLS